MPEPRGFGRRAPPDRSNDRAFLIPARAAPSDVQYRNWYLRDVYDQGRTSMCTSYAAVAWLRAGPVRNTGPLPSFQELYTDFQRNDEWPGEEPDYEGSSIRASMKVLKRRGYISEYRWAFDLEPLVEHVLTTSPCIAGVNWHTGMLDIDGDGFLHAGGPVVGGHAILVIGVNRNKRCPDGSLGAFRLHNSWSRNWGENGRAWISFRDMATLIRADGEVATATEAKAAA